MTRQRRADRPKERTLSRINLEVYPEEEDVIARAKAAAALSRESFRAWVIGAICQRLERESGEGGDDQAR